MTCFEMGLATLCHKTSMPRRVSRETCFEMGLATLWHRANILSQTISLEMGFSRTIPNDTCVPVVNYY